MYILIREQGTKNGLPVLSPYSEDGRTTWTTDDAEVFKSKLDEVRNTLTIFDGVASVIDIRVKACNCPECPEPPEVPGDGGGDEEEEDDG